MSEKQILVAKNLAYTADIPYIEEMEYDTKGAATISCDFDRALGLLKDAHELWFHVPTQRLVVDTFHNVQVSFSMGEMDRHSSLIRAGLGIKKLPTRASLMSVIKGLAKAVEER
jgi:hypothetical protein